MLRIFLQFLLLALLGGGAAASAQPVEPSAAISPGPVRTGKTQAVVIPVRSEIATPALYVIRRGLKEAIDQKVDVVILDMKTPGGALDVTFEIMEALAKFPGRTITFVNTEAISAGAFISAVTQDIYFAPEGVIGAAAPVMATGQEIDPSMKQKIVSYLRARVRASSEGKGYRGQVISAMIDADYELKIGDKVLKPKGELLSLTASEASATYGEPAQPLLAAGTAKDVDDLLTQLYGANGYDVKRLEVTWSEQLAQYLNAIAPVLLGLGMLALFVEFKTPGFGFFGIAGIVLLGIVFLGHYVAGFSGHEPMLVFALGLVLLVLEIFLFPGGVVLALSGLVLMLGSLAWSMADLWPNEPVRFTGEVFVGPLTNVGLGLLVSVVAALALLRFLPRGWLWDRMILTAAVGAAAQTAGGNTQSAAQVDTLIGRRGLAATGLFPSGQVEIDGERYEARLAIGSATPGAEVVVVGRTGFGLLVEVAAS